MKCKAFITELADYLDEAVDSPLRAEIEAHMAKCPDCKVVVDTCRKTIEIFCNSEPVPLTDDCRQRLHSALEKKLRRPQA